MNKLYLYIEIVFLWVIIWFGNDVDDIGGEGMWLSYFFWKLILFLNDNIYKCYLCISYCNVKSIGRGVVD